VRINQLRTLPVTYTYIYRVCVIRTSTQSLFGVFGRFNDVADHDLRLGAVENVLKDPVLQQIVAEEKQKRRQKRKQKRKENKNHLQWYHRVWSNRLVITITIFVVIVIYFIGSFLVELFRPKDELPWWLY